MLKKIRVALAIVFVVLITTLFLDFTGTVHGWWGWLAKIQFLPAVLAVNVGVVLGLILLTLICGRIYCSVICPLGVFQDFVSWLSSRRKKKKFRFSYSPAKKWLRYGILVVFVVACVAGVGSFVALLAPYSSYGRMVQNLAAPIYGSINNVLAAWAESINSYAFYHNDVWVRNWWTFGIAIVTFVVIVVLAWRNGRTYCNTICPVGTILGFFARFSWLKPVIDTSKCVNCRRCEKGCKAACIDIKAHHIDYSRCVACMNCIGTCHKSAISYVHPAKISTSEVVEEKNMEKSIVQKDAVKPTQVDQARRTFLATSAMAATAAIVKAQEKTVDGGLAVIEDKKIPLRATPLLPPGARSRRDFAHRCTACQLCVSVCPNGVLRPSSSLTTLMQPEMSYERGFCRPECTKCSDVCPAGAIRSLSVADKSATQIGHAVWVKDNCVVLTDGVSCGNCARHCPAGAIQMVATDSENPESPKIPVVNVERCIGCGACEYRCPARPFSAIYVEGHEMHKTI